MKKTYIFGHKKPDTDSVGAAIALSYLNNQLGIFSEARVLDSPNEETKFALNYFKIGRAHVWTPVTWPSRMPSSAWKKKKETKKKKKKNTYKHI